jgi:hypothetical protein
MRHYPKHTWVFVANKSSFQYSIPNVDFRFVSLCMVCGVVCKWDFIFNFNEGKEGTRMTRIERINTDNKQNIFLIRSIGVIRVPKKNI